MEYGNWELCNICEKCLVIKTVRTRLNGHTSTVRRWQFEPPGKITLDPCGKSPDWLMQQLPPPGEENWVVFCTRFSQESFLNA